ncbi:ATP-binding protein [Kovacikia minuta CCNUW1]|uniref:ATP-binding protein n=1 Tax=Kovacikia minuta TaxID=2931930 RepID=UPI001CCA4727|nr:ATP-binding protein [Kovacikia minuta]UBF27124.1 ATP-binding protein [Kovacikia minuta CCNUW1]
MTQTPIKAKDRDTVVQSLQAGVVPRRGQHLIQVGRVEETKAVIRDLDRITEGGSAIRFVIGEYGSGKTFFLSLVRSIALEKKLVTAHADLTPDRRLHATAGQARSLYAELMQNLATRTKPEGGALPSVIERFVTSAVSEGRDRNVEPEVVIRERLAHLSEMVGGYDFAEVIAAYWRGHDNGDETLKANAIRWLRGEYTTRTDARHALGVRTIVDDANVYDQLKLFTQLVQLAGYSGFLISLDELVNLYKLANTQARKSNYEQILRILNDCLQGNASGLGFMMGGTPDFLMDTRRGLYSYPALQSRLAENSFAVNGLVDYNNPVLRLGNLSPEDLFVLLSKIRHVFASGDRDQYLLPDEGIQAFMTHCSKRIGDAYFRTPRNTIKAFVDLLSVLEQNQHVTWTDLVSQVSIAPETNPDLLTAPIQDNGKVRVPAEGDDDDLASFRL